MTTINDSDYQFTIALVSVLGFVAGMLLAQKKKSTESPEARMGDCPVCPVPPVCPGQPPKPEECQQYFLEHPLDCDRYPHC